MARSNAIQRAREIAHSEIDDDAQRHLAMFGEFNGVVGHSQVLCLGYTPRAVTAGGIHLPDRALEEERFQGKAFLIIAKGPGAFKDDRIAQFYGFDPQVGTWIIARTSDGLEMFYQGHSVRLFEDVNIRIKDVSPREWY